MYLIQTVQTSWRPQLPLPKEVHVSDENADIKNKATDDMERQHHHHHSSSHNRKDSLTGSQISNASVSNSGKKWSFGRLFRRKKEIETESSSEEDRKAGFLPASKYPRNTSSNNNNSSNKSKTKSKSNRNSKLIGAGFDHIVVNPPQQQQQFVTQAPVKRAVPPQHLDNEFFLPFETVGLPEPFYQNQQKQHQQQHQKLLYPPQQEQQQQQQYLLQPQQPHLSRSSNSLDRRAAAIPRLSPNPKSRSAQRLATATATAAGLQVPVRSSSEEELISLNSSTFSKYRSDESIPTGGIGGVGGQDQNALSRRSRAARNERYYKRLSRDGEVSHGQIPIMYAPQPTQSWKTQAVPLSVYNGPPPQQMSQQPAGRMPYQSVQPLQQQTTSQQLRNAGSLQHVAPYVQWNKMQQQQQPKNLQNSVNDSKRSISYDSHIHLQNVNGRLPSSKPLPPPPPPRDPMRRVQVGSHIGNGNSGEFRPLSYAFDANGLAILPKSGLNSRCVSDDKIWAGHKPLYQSAQSLNMPSASYQQQQQTPQSTHNRRFITRAERDAQLGKKSLPNGIDIHYIADATPRSRKPIHMLEQQTEGGNNQPPPSSGILRTTKSGLPASPPRTVSAEYIKRPDEPRQAPNAGIVEKRHADAPKLAAFKPRSVSTSRVNDLRSYPSPMYSEVCKPNRKQNLAQQVSATQSQLQSQQQILPQQPSVDEVDHITRSTNMHLKPSQDAPINNSVELRHKDLNKSNSMPNHYQRRSGEIPTTPNKYDEYVAEKREQHHNPYFDPPAPPQRKLSVSSNVPLAPKNVSQVSAPAPATPSGYYVHKKPANLEEAISELEAIYKSLRLGNDKDAPAERKERVPTPSDFEKFALARADSYDDEDSPAGEPDPVRDDVAYRNIQLANLQHKANEKQPPFGIPIGPIVPSPHNDYLHVTPAKEKKIVATKTVPDIIKDDLAVRMLRKDPPGPKPHFVYPCGSLQKKNRATRTQSANIYSLIQRDAAKPSGGDLLSYLELTRNIDRSGSMSDIHHHADDSADIPGTLKLLRNLKEQDQLQAGATKKMPVLPFRHPSQGGAICQLPDKLTSPTKEDFPIVAKPIPLPRKSLTPEPTNTSHQMEDALNKIAKDAQESSAKLTKELHELRKEALITSSRPKFDFEEAKIEKDLQEIEAVSEAAKRCGKMLLDTLPDNAIEGDAEVDVKPRKLHKEGKLIKAIDEVSVAANAVCEKILKDIVTTEPPVVVQEAVKVQNKPPLIEPLVMPNLFRKLDPIKSEQIEAIAKRCMRQISELAASPAYDNIVDEGTEPKAACNDATVNVDRYLSHADETLISSVAESKKSTKAQIEEIDQIMRECEAQVRSEVGAHSTMSATSTDEQKTTAPSITTTNSCSSRSGSGNSRPGNSMPAATSSTTASSFSSSSDCLAKSSSPSVSRRLSSSITSFNPYSSSDYLKSPSSEYHAPSTDPIKTFSTTSYEVPSTSATPNITTNSTFSYSPSPPLNLTPVEGRTANARGEAGSTSGRERSSSPSQYNSSEELAMIFGIEEKPKQQQRRKTQQQQQLQQEQHQAAQAGNIGPNASMNTTTTNTVSSSSNHASSFACKPVAQLTNTQAACDNVIDSLNVNVASTTITTTTTTTTTLPTNANSSPSNCKLDTIPEMLEQDSRIEFETEEALQLSPNFNKIYASKISIIVDKVCLDENEDKEKVDNTDKFDITNDSTTTTATLLPNHLTQFDSLSSLEEEISSNPDSGNVSLADYPLGNGGTNASLQLQTAYNSRFEVRNSYVTEVCIPSKHITDVIDSVEKLNENLEEEFPPLPTEEELLDSLKEERLTKQKLDVAIKKLNETDTLRLVTDSDITTDDNDDAWDTATYSISEDYTSVHEHSNEQTDDLLSQAPPRKRSIVYETPQLNMCISEVRLNYELNESIDSLDAMDDEQPTTSVLAQISQCTAELEKLNEAMTEMPRRRAVANQQSNHTGDNNNCDDSPNLSLLPWQPLERLTTTTGGSAIDDGEEKPTTSASSLTLLGEARPAANSLTMLEHMLVACTLGVITSNDLFTLFLIIIGVITVIAIVLL